MPTQNSGSYIALKSAGIILLVALLMGAIFGLVIFANTSLNDNVLLPLVAIAGVVVLLAVLALVAVVFSTLGLDDSKQALGLPEGSIRAAIALALVVLFAILSVYLFDKIAPLTPAGAAAVTPAAMDLAKQLVTIIGTLMTAVAGFYFGAQSAASSKTSPSAEVSVATAPQPQNVLPTNASLQSLLAANKTLDLTVTGENLNMVKDAKIVDPKTGAQIVATRVSSNNNEVTSQVPVEQNTPIGTWDVVVSDGGKNSATLKGKFTLTA